MIIEDKHRDLILVDEAFRVKFREIEDGNEYSAYFKIINEEKIKTHEEKNNCVAISYYPCEGMVEKIDLKDENFHNLDISISIPFFNINKSLKVVAYWYEGYSEQARGGLIEEVGKIWISSQGFYVNEKRND